MLEITFVYAQKDSIYALTVENQGQIVNVSFLSTYNKSSVSRILVNIYDASNNLDLGGYLALNNNGVLFSKSGEFTSSNVSDDVTKYIINFDVSYFFGKASRLKMEFVVYGIDSLSRGYESNHLFF